MLLHLAPIVGHNKYDIQPVPSKLYKITMGKYQKKSTLKSTRKLYTVLIELIAVTVDQAFANILHSTLTYSSVHYTTENTQ